MSRRVVKLQTIRGYIGVSLTALERAIVASLRCERISPSTHHKLVQVYKDLARIKPDAADK